MGQMDTGQFLDGKTLLVVEDEPLLAQHITSELRGRGAIVVGPAPTVHYARLVCGKRHLDGAVLDIGLYNESVFPLADELMKSGVPVIFATGKTIDEIPSEYHFVERIPKPLQLDVLLAKVATLNRGAPIRIPRLEQTMPTAGPRSRIPSRAATESDRWCATLLATARQQLQSRGGRS
jgi:DNA-binding response OmpR family regulator